MEYDIKAIPTLYKGILLRSRHEAKYPVFFDMYSCKWWYEPFDLDQWFPDLLVIFNTKLALSSIDLTLLIEIKPYPSMQNYDGSRELYVAEHLDSFRLPCDGIALCGIDPSISKVYWRSWYKKLHRDFKNLTDMFGDWEYAWAEACNTVQWLKNNSYPAIN